MANDKQYKNRTLFIATRGVEEYRQTVSAYIQPYDRVLEIGCEWGTTSRVIYERCSKLVATDISPECIEKAKARNPRITFAVLDAFDIVSAMKLGSFTKIYIDMSGLSSYRSLLDVIALMNMYASVFKPEAIVIKSGSLKQFASKCKAWQAS